jgi:hypothetical protein
VICPHASLVIWQFGRQANAPKCTGEEYWTLSRGSDRRRDGTALLARRGARIGPGSHLEVALSFPNVALMRRCNP